MPGGGIDLKTPQVGSKTARRLDSDALVYWLSPSVSTESTLAFLSSVAVAPCLQCEASPSPPLNAASPGSQAISPAAPTTGSAATAAVGTASSAVEASVAASSALRLAKGTTRVSQRSGPRLAIQYESHPPDYGKRGRDR